jgi:hypothetical protein
VCEEFKLLGCIKKIIFYNNKVRAIPKGWSIKDLEKCIERYFEILDSKKVEYFDCDFTAEDEWDSWQTGDNVINL